MIQIKIRREWQASPAELAEVFDVNEIDDVRRSLQRWGIADEDSSEMVGQWVLTPVDDPIAYFEFVILDPDV